MALRIFLAGATGAIGRRLTPLLLDEGHSVAGTTRSAKKAEELRSAGIEPVVVDVFDAEALSRAVRAFRPDVVIHQLTDLAQGGSNRTQDELLRNARIRKEGTANLTRAAIAAGASVLVAQSVAWLYASGPQPHGEDDPLDLDAEGTRAISVGGVVALESAILNAPLSGVVLRYGQLYGPGTGVATRTGSAPLHVDAAAYAALLAVTRGVTGIVNIAEPNEQIATDKARIELGWHADFRLPAGLERAAMSMGTSRDT